jgi:hypothetical protein
MRKPVVGLALLSAVASISLSPGAHADPAGTPCPHPGDIGPNATGNSYIRCTDSGWITVNRAVCVDFPGVFDCAGNPIVRDGPKFSIPGDGTFVANTDMLPGTYRTSGPSAASSSCSWQLQRAVGVVTGNSQKAAEIVLGPYDRSFETSGCQPWTPTY